MPAVGAPTDEEQHKHNAEHPQPDARLLAPGRRCRWRRGAPVLAVPVQLVARFPFGSGYHPGANGFPMLSPPSGMVSVPTVRSTDFRRGPANLLCGIRPGDAYASQMTANGPKPTRLNRMQPCMQTATVQRKRHATESDGKRPEPPALNQRVRGSKP